MNSMRLPPQNLEAERSTIGSCLLDRNMIDEVCEILRGPQDFYRDAHAEIWKSLVAVHESGESADILTLTERLRKQGQFDKVGGHDILTEIVESVPTAANAKYYANIVKEKATNRQLIDLATEILDQGYSNQLTAGELLDLAQQKIFEIAEHEVQGQTVDSKTLMAEAMSQLEARKRGDIVGIPTYFNDLDKALMGMQNGDLIILAARPSMGKTAFAGNVSERVARWSGPVLFVSIEMPRRQIGDRFLASQSKVHGSLIKYPKGLPDSEIAKIYNAAGEIEKLPIFVDDSPIRTLSHIGASARKTKRKHGLALIVVDYLSKITESAGTNRQETVAIISAGLKSIARQVGVPILCLHQLNRNCENRADRKPMMSDLRESGAIEADADVVLLLHRQEFIDGQRPGEADLEIAKNRTGETGNVVLAFRKELTRFDSISHREESASKDPEARAYRDPSGAAY